MTVRVAPRAGDTLATATHRVVLLARGADDGAAALAGLDAARTELARLGPGLLSPVVRSPEGPLLLVADLPAEEDELRAIPEQVATALREAGVRQATVEARIPGGPLDQLDRVPGAVVLRVFPVPAGPAGVLPPSWLDLAAEWVLADLSRTEEVALRLLGAHFDVAAADASATLFEAARAGAWCDLVQGDLRDRIRTASLTFGHAPHLALAAGGPGCDGHALLARFELLCDLARDLVDGVAYACVDFEPTFELLGLGLAGSGWPEQGGARPNSVASLVGDVAVPDAYPFQILGPGHVERLGQQGRQPIGRPLGDGRYEVGLGDPVDWLPRYEARDDMLEQATKALEGLLITEAELGELAAARPLRPPLPAHAPTPRGGLDLADVTLEPLPHPRRGLRLTLLELAAWLAQEHHSDGPASVSPVLAAYARWLSAGLDEARRQALKPYAERLVGTRTPGLPRGPWRPLADADEARAWMAAEWLARTQAARWLRAAGCTDAAAALGRVRTAAGPGRVEPLLKALDGALADLSARLRGTTVDEAAWEAWEAASEPVGWVAASEAAWVGIPEGLASAIELRVVEVARAAPQGRARVAVAVAEAAREAGLAEVAAAAWRGAARAAAQALDAMAGDPDAPAPVLPVSLATAHERACQGTATRLGLDRDAVDVALEQADQAARERLAALVADPVPRPFDAARAAAEASPGGAVWAEVDRTTAGMIGEEGWASVLAAGRTAVGRVLHHAHPLLERATLVAVAREVAGQAGRLLAATSGADAVEQVVDELRPAAVALLDDLLAVG